MQRVFFDDLTLVVVALRGRVRVESRDDRKSGCLIIRFNEKLVIMLVLM